MEAIILSLLLWINQNTNFDYQLHHGIPNIEQADQMQLADLILDDSASLLKQEDTVSFNNYIDRLEAVYDHKTKTILISSKIDLHTAYARSVIVHELVHYIQYQQKMNDAVECLNALEKDAYDIQAAYMEDHGIPKTFDKVTVALRSMCFGYGD